MAVSKPGMMAVPRGMTPPEPKNIETKFREVSQLYEKQFMREMVKAMRATVPESGLIKTNQAEKIFREQLDEQYVDKWSDRGGVGYADLIFNQLMDKYGSLVGKHKLQKPQGPIAMDAAMEQKSKTNVKFELTESAQQKRMDMQISPEGGKWTKQDVLSPWGGTLLNRIALGEENQMVEVEHDNGLLGRYVFKGIAEDLAPQTKLEAGQRLGRVSPDSTALYWSLRNSPAEKGPEATAVTGE